MSPILNEELIELGKYMRDTYLSSLVASYEAMLPKSLKLADSKINIKYVTYIKKIKNKVKFITIFLICLPEP